MDTVLADLLTLLKPEEISTDLYRGGSHDIGTPQVFGGQVLGQALYAASLTVDPSRPPHSLHAYFLRRGDVHTPIDYEVDRARDGASFSNRRVVAHQQGRSIFNLSASFQKQEKGIEHQVPMPDVPGPEGLDDKYDLSDEVLEQMHERLRIYIKRPRPFMVRPVQKQDFLNPRKVEPVKQVWIKAVDNLPDDPLLHQALFAYVSDYELLGTATLPHGISFTNQGIQMASLDHALWFYHPFRIDEWLLFVYDSPVSAGSRGLARGAVYTRTGKLVATSVQEGLIRVRE
ncbi:MAG: acyl-CoA thioesterase [Gammaproteobacteria bacterium]